MGLLPPLCYWSYLTSLRTPFATTTGALASPVHACSCVYSRVLGNLTQVALPHYYLTGPGFPVRIRGPLAILFPLQAAPG